MAAITEPRIDPDGTHVIPVTGIHRPGETPNNDAIGEVRWRRRDGLTFWFQAPLTSFLLFAEKPMAPRSGAGSVQSVSFDPQWIAQTADGSVVRLYSTSSQITTKVTSGWNVEKGGASESFRRVEGTACYADVDLHRDNALSFWHETPRSHRLFSPGWELWGWPMVEDIEFTIAGSVHSRKRCSLPMSGPCDRQLIAAFGQPKAQHGVWLTYQIDELTDPFWFPKPCDHVRGLLSILLGQHVPFVWRDTPVTDDRLNRLYFGWFKGEDLDHPRFQLIPLFGTVESLTHGKDVTTRLVSLDQQYAELSKLFNPEWVVSPLWAAADDFLDNQLAHACVVLERLASAYHDHVRPTGRYPKLPALLSPKQKGILISRLREVLKEVAESEDLTSDTSKIVGKRIDNLFQPTNNDRLVMVFEELGIELGELERDAIRNRNKCMHGKPTLKDGKDTSQCNEELHRYDILRTLIGRALLHLLGYDGPYIDYAARPESGNFPIRKSTPPTLCDPAVPFAE